MKRRRGLGDLQARILRHLAGRAHGFEAVGESIAPAGQPMIDHVRRLKLLRDRGLLQLEQDPRTGNHVLRITDAGRRAIRLLRVDLERRPLRRKRRKKSSGS